MQPEKSNRYAVRSAGKISFFSGFGFVFALLIDVIIAGRFGLSQETDALFIALTLPQLVASILLVAANVAFVPIFTKVLLVKGKSGLWLLTSSLINLNLLLFTLIGLMGAFASSFIISSLGAGLNDPTKKLAVDLSRILFFMTIPLGGIEVIKSTLNSLNSFAYPAATTVIKNLALFLIILIIPSHDIRVVAIGYVIATFIQFSFLLVNLFFKGFRYQFGLNLDNEWTREALRQVRHPVAGALIGQGNVILERFLASFLPLGVVSALGYARRVLRAVDDIFLGSVTTAFLPRLSAQSAISETTNYRKTLITSIKMLAFISFPITALVIGFSESIVRLLFERGAFSVDNTQTMALLLSIYVSSIPAWAIFQALQTSYYSTGDTKRPFQFRIMALGFNIILDFALFYWLGAPGLALALSFSRVIITIYTAWKLNRHIQIVSSQMMLFIARIMIASLILGIILFVLRGQFGTSVSAAHYRTLIDMTLRGLIGIIVFIASLFLLQVKEVTELLYQLRNHLRFS